MSSKLKHSGKNQMSEIDEHISKIFDIKKRLGKGAYGIVWKAVDKRNNHTVALKKIFDAFRDETDAQRTFREISFLKAFRNHANIVRLENVYRASNNLDIYLIFEFMESDLHNIIKKGTILKDIHKRFVMYQLINAVKYIHSGNVIHRDLKPSNILIDNKCRCKLADFGLARSLSNRPNTDYDERIVEPQLTDYVATRWYRAPEILVASKNYTKGIDMWSLGCILGEMIRGKPLFQGSSTVNQIEKIVGALPDISERDITAVGAGFGSVLLNKQATKEKHCTLSELLFHGTMDGINLVKSLLVLDPLKRLTAKEAIRHSYVESFRNAALEAELNFDVLPPYRDDIRLTVPEYRSKLYEMAQASLDKGDAGKKKSHCHKSTSTTHQRNLKNRSSIELETVRRAPPKSKIPIMREDKCTSSFEKLLFQVVKNDANDRILTKKVNTITSPISGTPRNPSMTTLVAKTSEQRLTSSTEQPEKCHRHISKLKLHSNVSHSQSQLHYKKHSPKRSVDVKVQTPDEITFTDCIRGCQLDPNKKRDKHLQKQLQKHLEQQQLILFEKYKAKQKLQQRESKQQQQSQKQQQFQQQQQQQFQQQQQQNQHYQQLQQHIQQQLQEQKLLHDQQHLHILELQQQPQYQQQQLQQTQKQQLFQKPTIINTIKTKPLPKYPSHIPKSKIETRPSDSHIHISKSNDIDPREFVTRSTPTITLYDNKNTYLRHIKSDYLGPALSPTLQERMCYENRLRKIEQNLENYSKDIETFSRTKLQNVFKNIPKDQQPKLEKMQTRSINDAKNYIDHFDYKKCFKAPSLPVVQTKNNSTKMGSYYSVPFKGKSECNIQHYINGTYNNYNGNGINNGKGNNSNGDPKSSDSTNSSPISILEKRV